MSDFVKDAKFLSYYHTSEDMMKDKDFLKNNTYKQYEPKILALWSLPLFFNIWQLRLINQADKIVLYNKVRVFKSLTLVGAIAFSFWEKVRLQKQWRYFDRVYPEATMQQKQLEIEAAIFLENNYKPKTQEEREKMDPEVALNYEQMYRLPPLRNTHPEKPVSDANDHHW